MKSFILFLIIASMAYGRMEVSATIFPVYDAARVIGGEMAEVSLLVKPGIEPHSFEPSPRDIAGINRSDIFLYLDRSMESWIGKFEKNIDTETVAVSRGIDFIEEEDHSHGHHHHTKDPHIWLDPLRYIKVAENIMVILSERDPENAGYYRGNYEEYRKELKKLHEDFQETFINSRHKTIIYAGHFSFSYFTERYGLEYVSVYKNLSPNASISPRDLQKIIRVVRESGQDYIYQEALVNSKTARLISEETGSGILLLHQLGGVTKEEMKRNSSYIELMRENLENLRKGLGYGKDN